MTVPLSLLAALVLGAAPAEFKSETSEIPAEIAARMKGVTLHPGCPVPPEDLRFLRVSHWDFAGEVKTGEIIVNKDVAADVVKVFETMFANKFPVEKMRLIDEYGGSDDKSMEDDNTSAFNCRLATGAKKTFSKHSFGRAIDINPRVNPYVKGTHFEPANAEKFLDRTIGAPGMIVADDGVVKSFKALGWTWGGEWNSLKDYQHFEKQPASPKATAAPKATPAPKPKP